MRMALSLVALSTATAAAADAPQPGALPSARSADSSLAAGEHVCRDRIRQVRAERGLPQLDDGAADRPLMILAVDKRIGGCSVMVMAYDANDIRPVPTAEQPARLRKIQ